MEQNEHPPTHDKTSQYNAHIIHQLLCTKNNLLMKETEAK